MCIEDRRSAIEREEAGRSSTADASSARDAHLKRARHSSQSIPQLSPAGTGRPAGRARRPPRVPLRRLPPPPRPCHSPWQERCRERARAAAPSPPRAAPPPPPASCWRGEGVPAGAGAGGLEPGEWISAQSTALAALPADRPQPQRLKHRLLTSSSSSAAFLPLPFLNWKRRSRLCACREMMGAGGVEGARDGSVGWHGAGVAHVRRECAARRSRKTARLYSCTAPCTAAASPG